MKERAGQELYFLVLCILCALPNAEQCNANQYRCNTGVCIVKHKHCDGKIDCTDVSDEKGCGLKIAWPYPPNVWGPEGGSIKVACTARDDNDYPRIVKFRRRKNFAWVDIPNTDRVYQTNYTANKTIGLTRTAVLHINDLQMGDDGSSDPYLCHASRETGLDKTEQRFTVSIIQKTDFPRAKLGGASVNYNEQTQLTCNITYPGKAGQVTLESLAWMRDNRVIQNGTTTLEPYVIPSAKTKDGGDYVCMSNVKIRSSVKYGKALGTAKLTVFVKFFNAPINLSGKLHENITLECPAEGYPLNIKWFKRTTNGTEVTIEDDDLSRNVNTGKYLIRRPCSYCRFNLTITNLRPKDKGVYICRAVGNSAGSGEHLFKISLSASSKRVCFPILPLFMVGILCVVFGSDW